MDETINISIALEYYRKASLDCEDIYCDIPVIVRNICLDICKNLVDRTFIVLSGHGVDDVVIDDAYIMSKYFFKQSVDDKSASVRLQPFDCIYFIVIQNK